MTRKPCPGCRKEADRPVGGVCRECEDFLRAGRASAEAASRKREKTSYYRLSRDWPHIFHLNGAAIKNLPHALQDLARAVMSPATKTVTPYDEKVLELPRSGEGITYFTTYDRDATVWSCSKRVAEAIEKMDLALREALRLAYEDGKREGSSFLMQLARGNISVNQLTQQAIDSRYDTDR